MKHYAVNIVLLAIIGVCCWKIYDLQQVRNELIELNHDKSLYIDNGCRGEYQGTEEIR